MIARQYVGGNYRGNWQLFGYVRRKHTESERKKRESGWQGWDPTTSSHWFLHSFIHLSLCCHASLHVVAGSSRGGAKGEKVAYLIIY
jgi:hypothetical protein